MKKLFLTLVLASSAAISFAQVPSYVPTNGLVGWWPFNGNANDESGNGNNGTVNGATLTADRFGNVGKAYSFDGLNNSISLADTNTFNFGGNNFTISIWIYKNQNVVNWDNSFAIGAWNNGSITGSNEWAIMLAKSGDGGNNDFISFNFESNNQLYKCISPFELGINQWYNATVVKSIDSIKLYLNGIQVGSEFVPQVLMNDNNRKVKISYPDYGSTFSTDGLFDDIGIWNRALTQQEITDLYNGNICYQNITVTDTLLINTGITGFNPITYENTLRVWPNPTNDHITIDAGNLNVMNGYSIRITNSLGQQMFLSAINQQQFYLDLSTWTGNGMYFLNLIDPSGNIIDIKKIVLQ